MIEQEEINRAMLLLLKRVNLMKYKNEETRVRVMVISYALYLMQTNKAIEIENVSEFILKLELEKKLYEQIVSYINDDIDFIKENINSISSDVLREIMLNEIDEIEEKMFTPTSIRTLMFKLLELNKTESLLEMYCDTSKMYLNNHDERFSYLGLEINEISYVISKIRSLILGKNFNCLKINPLEYSEENKCDKICSNFPLGDIRSVVKYRKNILKYFGINNEIKCSGDWIYCASILKNLKHTGKAIAVISNGAIINFSDIDIRREFISKGYIETVILLPPKLFERTMISTTLVIFSFGNKEVKFIDASELFEQGRRANVLSEGNIDDIYNLLNVENDKAIVKSVVDIEKNNFDLNPMKYLTKKIINDGIELEKLITKITRGATIRASELDNLNSLDETNYRYIKLSNINNGLLEFKKDIQYLTEIPEKYKKNCLKKNTMILSKMGINFKSAIVDLEGDIELLPSENFILIEFDEEKVNPTFIQAFLSSEKGKKSLQNSLAGTSIPIIRADSLKKILVPNYTLEEQGIVIEKYKLAQNKIRKIEQEVQNELEIINKIF